jgi:ribulose-phosphate 3-epimerase
MNKKLSVSLMCCDLMNVARDVKNLEDGGVDWFHLDMMDAHLVPNLTFGPDFVNGLRKISDTPFDIHMMIEDPEFIINSINLFSKDYVTLHVELQKDILYKNMALLKTKGVHFGLALNPETPVGAIEPYVDDIDLVLLMLVRPGFAGGKMIEGIMDKVKQMKTYLAHMGKDNVLISTDGNITLERAKFMATQGADVFVGGTSAVFRKGMDIKKTVPDFYKFIAE